MSTSSKSDESTLKKALAEVDWAKIDAMTDEDIARQVAEDPDAAPILTDEDFKRMRAVYPPDWIDVREIRRRKRLSQAAFAARYGFTLGSVRNWEQGRRRPEGAARILLELIERNPKAVEEVLKETG